MKINWLVCLALCCSNLAMADDSGVSVTVGARAWYTDWTTFSYFVDESVNPPQNLALTQVSAGHELAIIPLLSVRYRDFVGSISGWPSTTFTFDDGNDASREEIDANVGYYVMPGIALTIGYKKVSQSDGPNRYRPAGPVLGVIGNAPLEGPWSLYGNLGVGRLKTPGGDDIEFDADYGLAELGLAYTIDGNRLPRSWTLTAGYRIQILTSKEAFVKQDGRDTTQGFTVGVMATF